MYKRKTKKMRLFFSALGILSMIFFETVPIYSAQASIQDTIDWMLENGSGYSSLVTEESLLNSSSMTGDYSSAQQSGGPIVKVSFTAGGAFINGTKITATAVPGNFITETSKLYFTWYIKHRGCDLKQDVGKTNNCDLDGDQDITVNDWKIAAARIVARGDFDIAIADYSSTKGFDSDAAGTEADPSVTDEWVNNFKRDDNGDLLEDNGSKESVRNCYVQEPKSGIIYELTSTSPVFNSCPDGYLPSCVKDNTTVCSSQNLNACTVDTQATASDGAEDILDCTIANDAALRDFTSSATCKLGGDPVCVSDSSNTRLTNKNNGDLLAIIFEKNTDLTTGPNETNGVCDALEEIPESSRTCDYATSGLIDGITSGGSTIFDGDDDLDLIAENFNENASSCSFEREKNLCKHLFPYFPKKKVTVRGNEVDLGDAITGDGEFSMAEKEFWGTDPTNPETNGKEKDEAAVIGQGVDQFSWTYTEGDEVGVVVEGESRLQEEHLGGLNRIMWAFSNGKCTELEELSKKSSITNGERSFYPDYDSNQGIFAAEFDLDRCLEENLLEPDNSGANEMKISLEANPASPINDPGGFGDYVTVTTATQNVADLNSIYYEWKIQKSGDGASIPNEDTVWTDITTDMIEKYGSLSEADRRGLGKNQLKFLLNLPAEVADPSGEGMFYLRVKTDSTEETGYGSQKASGSIIIKVREQNNSIVAYSVVASDGGALSLLNNAIGTSGTICSDLSGQTRCLVAKNQIVGVVIPNANNDLSGFSWRVNNVPMNCTSSVSVSCSGTNNNVLIFPILGNVGEAIDVVGMAMSKKTGGTIEIRRHFLIVDPQIQITSLDTSSAWPKLLGFYKDMDGNKTPDYSSEIYETNTGSTVKLQANISSAWGYSSQQLKWVIDGEEQDNITNTISFPVDRLIGDNYNVGVVLSQAHNPEADKQVNNLRKALLKNWGVSADDSVINDISANVQIKVVGSSFQAATKTNQTGPFASLITNIPQQLLFFLKVTLTAFLMMFLMGIIFSLVPESLFKKENIG
jgi:hypothetical protein